MHRRYIYAVLFVFLLYMWQLSKWQHSHLEAERVLAGIEKYSSTEYPLSHEGRGCSCPHLRPNSSVALVSALTDGAELALYVQSLEKLHRTTRRFTSMDTVLLTWLTGATAEGWATCNVEPIEGPAGVSNRFFQAHMYSKLRVWGLTQYEAVLYVDSDTLLLRPFDGVFSLFGTGVKLAMSVNGIGATDFNAGVMLVRPNCTELDRLVAAINHTEHDTGLAEQGFLNAFYKGEIELLPFTYNAMVSEKAGKHRDVWMQLESEMVLLHYTCKPWHAWNCWWDDIEDLCLLWHLAATPPFRLETR